jgi:hypothetical protein
VVFAAESSEISLGTRFLIYPQAPHVPGYSTPETVWVSTPPDEIRSGPADNHMYVRDPVLEKEPYEFPFLPPYLGETHPAAEPGPDGHFDAMDRQSRQFLATHAYACVRRVLDIWESYLGHPIRWHFFETYERLEIVPCLDWENAQSGYGFLELGTEYRDDGSRAPFALNFDIIAHEVGHAILFSLFGAPEITDGQDDFGALHESCSDLVSLISFLHFDSGLDRLLRGTRGNLLALNELNRIGETADERQIRIAGNARKMSEVTREVHDRSRPFTGAVFDTMLEICYRTLVERGLADERLLREDLRAFDERTLRRISQETSRAYRTWPFLFKSALTEARDVVGVALAKSWERLEPYDLKMEFVAATIVDEATRIDPESGRIFDGNFAWREIL